MNHLFIINHLHNQSNDQFKNILWLIDLQINNYVLCHVKTKI